MAEQGENRFWHVFAGSYSQEDQEGIGVYRFCGDTREMLKFGGVRGLAGPSYLAFDSSLQVLYSVSETEAGEVAAFRFDRQSGDFTELNRQSSEGIWPCYISFDLAKQHLYTVNYGSGNVVVYPINQNGSIGKRIDHAQHEGRSVHPERQEGPHTHTIRTDPSGQVQIVTDLGTDEIYVYRLAPDERLVLESKLRITPGSGPRHVEFHPDLPLMYVLNELSNTLEVIALDYDKWTGKLLQSISTLPDDFKGSNACAHVQIHPSGRWIYASNRGHDSIVLFELQEDGTLVRRGHVSSCGRTPRNFAIVPDGRHMLVANQDSDSIVVFAISPNGWLQPTGHSYETNKPVCLVIASAREDTERGSTSEQ